MMRIFVGTPANNEDLECQAVLDFALRKHATLPIDLTWMMRSRDPSSYWYGWNATSWATPFSALRWGIPKACNFEGRAIYMDCDQIPTADFRELWEQPIPDGKAMLAKFDGNHVVSCVVLFDCARMKNVIDYDRLKTQAGYYREIRQSIFNVTARYKDDWNCRDGEGCRDISEPHVKNVHYTSIPSQPNHRHARERLRREGREHWWKGRDVQHPRADIVKLFDDTLAAAIAAGRGPEHFRVSPEFGDYGR